MKSILFPIFAILPALSYADDFYSSFPVTAATVFGQGAMVSQQANVTLPEGQHDIFLPLSQSMMQNGTPQFAVSGATPVSISFMNGLPVDVDEFLTDAQKATKKTVEDLKDAIAAHRAEFSTLAGQRDGLDTQFQFLKQISPNGKDAVPTLEQLQGIASYLPTAFAENRAARGALELQLIAGEKALRDLEEELVRAEADLNGMGLPTAQGLVARLTVLNDATPEVTVFSEGFTSQANWQIQYDARLDENAGQINLDRRAMVSQFTGAAWVDAVITLSSAEPFQRLQPNIPNRDVVRLLEVPKPRAQVLSKANVRSLAEADVEEALSDAMFAGGVTAAAPVAGNFNGIEVTYKIPQPTTISAGNSSAEQINLASLTLDATIDRYASPRRDKTAFVRAKATNIAGEPILPGQTTFYRGDTLIGQGFIQDMAAGAEATLYFGPDDTLPLKMKFLSELKGDKGVFTKSNTRSEEMAFEIENIGTTTQNVTLAYALPITVNEDVKVDVTANPNPTTTDVDGVKGRSEWVVDLKAGQKQSVSLNVDITWPEGQNIQWRP